jgi:anti-repressor protein
MSSIQPFDFKGTAVRTVTYESGETWWVLKDVCDALALSNPSRVASRLEDDEISKFDLGPNSELGHGMNTEANIVNESGLYNVILRSDKPEARQFRKWVTGEVLPQIRQHGAYMTSEVIERTLTSPDYLIQLATQLKQEQQRRRAAEVQSVKQAARIDVLEPKAQALDDFTSTKHSYSLSDAAKILANGGRRIGQRVLVSYLLEIGWVFRSEGRLHPYQDRVDGGFLESRAYPTRVLNGKSKTFTPQTRVTTKGLASIWRKLYGKGITTADLGKAA